MSLDSSNTLAALAAVVLAFTSIATIVTVPPAHASSAFVTVALA